MKISLAIFFIIYSLGFNKIIAQTKTVFSNNLIFTLPQNWNVQDSSSNKIVLKKTGDAYSKIEIKFTEHKEPNLVKYMALDKKKFAVDPHTRTILPDEMVNKRLFKKIKYYTKNNILKVNTELEYVTLFIPKNTATKIKMARLEVISTYAISDEAAFLKTVNSLLESLKY